MGKAALIVVVGMTIVMGRMLVSSNEQTISLSQKITDRHEKIISRYIVISGANVALSNLSDDPESRTNIASTSFNGGTFSVTVTDLDSVVELSVTGTYLDVIRTIEIITTSRAPLEDLALYATGGVSRVDVLDEFGTPDSTLMEENQGELPEIYDQNLIDMATSQGQVQADAVFYPTDGYPNGSFYYSDTTANVTHVLGDLWVQGGRTIYGIFVVEGNITMEGSAEAEGVLYTKNPGYNVSYGGGGPDESSVVGGIIAYGDVTGSGNHINITYNPAYMNSFVTFGNVTSEAGLQVKSWTEY